MLIKLQEAELVDGGPGKPVGIAQMIGRRPIAAFGNSDGDFQMLEQLDHRRHQPRLEDDLSDEIASMDTRNRLVALVFDDPYTADEARAALRRMAGEGLLELGETALIVKGADGKVRVSQDTDTVASDKHIGHIAGLVTAAVTGITPLILAGTICGKLIGTLRDNGITDAFLKALQKEVKPNTSTLVMFGRSHPEGRKEIVRRLATFKPTVLESDLPPEVEHALAETFRKAGGVPR